MILDFGLGTILLALGVTLLVLLTLAMVFYEQLMVVLAWLLNITFVTGLALAATSLLAGVLYDFCARELVVASGVPGELREVDAWIDAVRTLPDRILEQIKRPFADDPPPAPEGAPIVTRAAPPVGALESAVTSALASGVALVARTIAFGVGVAMMLVALLNRSGVDLVLEIRALRQRIEVLERLDEE